MFRDRTRYAVLIAALVGLVLAGAGFPLSLAHAHETTSPAHGLPDAVLACDQTVDGLQVNFAQSSPRLRDRFNPQQGESCLPILAQIPRPHRSELPLFAQLTAVANGTDTTIEECLIWILDGNEISEGVVGCDLAEDDLVTRFVNLRDGQYTPQPGELCFDTLAALATQGTKLRGPMAATLGVDVEDNPVGGLAWVKNGPDSLEVIECNLDEQDELLTTYRESSTDGVDASAVGEPCLATLANGAGPNSFLSGPVPRPRGTTSVDPECLIWDIAGGGINEEDSPPPPPPPPIKENLMARPLRIEYPGALYHLTSRGNTLLHDLSPPRAPVPCGWSIWSKTYSSWPGPMRPKPFRTGRSSRCPR